MELTRDLGTFRRAFIRNLYFRRGTTMRSASTEDVYQSLAMTVRDHLMSRRARTSSAQYQANPRFVNYLSAEYMLGKQLEQNLFYTGTVQAATDVLAELDLTMDDVLAHDREPGLGNGGLGRLAACLLDSMATMDLPAIGYGIRYEFGIFRQSFLGGAQQERADDWTFFGSPWEFPQPDDTQVVGFYGTTAPHPDDLTGPRRIWTPAETVLGEPSHMLVPGYGTETVNIIRLWRARASQQTFNLDEFARGHYDAAVEGIVRSETISKVLYPDDSTAQGKELRLKQQYFLVTCSLRDIIRRYRFRNSGWERFPEKVVIQLNDTHPVMAIAELMRLLIDEYGVEWERAWLLTQRTFAYTCHTLLPEALETWPSSLIGSLLPRHLEIIQLINHFFLNRLRHSRNGHDISALSLFGEGGEQRVRMANLAVVGTHAVNGVAELHSRLLTETTLSAFADVYPEKFTNVTNGVTPRRFIKMANPRLSKLITETLGSEDWVRDLSQLKGLERAAGDAGFREQWGAAKRAAKQDLARYVAVKMDLTIVPDALTDVMIKRFHQYKRQMLKVLHVVTLFNRIKLTNAQITPRTVVFGGKAAPSYWAAKRVMKLINAIASTVNNDPMVAEQLRVAFIPDYNVTRAQMIIPAANLSEQISMAGKEASGTGNMKLALNGALTIGTYDGANIEIVENVGEENFFGFGLPADKALGLREAGTYNPRDYYDQDDELRAALDAISHGRFGTDFETFHGIADTLLNRDEYLALADFRSYVDAQDRVDKAWADQDAWQRMSILNTARCGFFSSDRTIQDYCDRIWHVQPVQVPTDNGH
ncbi:MAG: glycogen phosphorylase [Micrococcales bacterium]|nr:MAG: glycogen phosphorylase [Micrococcales bacterium]